MIRTNALIYFNAMSFAYFSGLLYQFSVAHIKMSDSHSEIVYVDSNVDVKALYPDYLLSPGHELKNWDFKTVEGNCYYYNNHYYVI